MVAIALGCALLNYAIRAVRWVWYLHILEIPVKLKESVPIFLIGLMLSATPGKAGELFKSYLLKLACGARMSRTAPVVVVERNGLQLIVEKIKQKRHEHEYESEG